MVLRTSTVHGETNLKTVSPEIDMLKFSCFPRQILQCVLAKQLCYRKIKSYFKTSVCIHLHTYSLDSKGVLLFIILLLLEFSDTVFCLWNVCFIVRYTFRLCSYREVQTNKHRL